VFEEEDRETGYAVFIAITVAILVSLFVIAIAIGHAIGQPGESKRPGRPMAATSIVRIAAVVYFEANTAEPPADLRILIAPAVRAVRTMPATKVVVSAYHDTGGDAAANVELARQRAAAVRDALLAAGIAARRIEVAGSVALTDSADPDQVRRVEITLR
jgi:outer membrane protein OmpA-like peptidoglycan-associated protein